MLAESIKFGGDVGRRKANRVIVSVVEVWTESLWRNVTRLLNDIFLVFADVQIEIGIV